MNFTSLDLKDFNSIVNELYPNKEKYTNVHFVSPISTGDIVTFKDETPNCNWNFKNEVCEYSGYINKTDDAKIKQWKVHNIICLVDEKDNCNSYVEDMSALKLPSETYAKGWMKMVNTKYLKVIKSKNNNGFSADVTYPYPIGTKFYSGILDNDSNHTFFWKREQIKFFKMIAKPNENLFILGVNITKKHNGIATFDDSKSHWNDGYVFNYTINKRNNNITYKREIIPFEELNEFITDKNIHNYKLPNESHTYDYNRTKQLLMDMGSSLTTFDDV